ncbi:hypothetical protein VR45_32910, partial [Streptomyces sp. NRRL S-495]
MPLVSASTTTVPLDGLVPPDTGSLDRELDQLGERVRTAAGPGLAAVLDRPQARVTTLDVAASGPELPSPYGKPPRFSLVHAQPDGAGGTVEYLQGRAPRQPGADPRVPAGGAAPIEVAVSDGTRERLGLTVGRRFDLSDRGWAAPVLVVGVFRTDRGAGRLWQQSPMLVSPWTVAVDPGQELSGQLLTSADGIETIAKHGLAVKVVWELPTAVDRSGPAATPAGIAAMQSALRGLRAAGPDRLCGSRLT